MTSYIIRRLMDGIIVLVISTMILFLIARLMPGDPILLYIGENQLTSLSAGQINEMRHEFGLDKPLFAQYFDWIFHVLQGNLGKSISWGTSVRLELARAIPVSISVGALAFVVSLFIGVTLGVITAVRRGKATDTILTTLANLGITIPDFWLGILLVLVFGLYLRWFPTMGYVSLFKNFPDSVRHLVLPIACLSIFPIAGIVRQTRSSMLEVIRQDYIRTARAKGLSERRIIIMHALKNGLIPVVTLSGMSVPRIFGGQVMIETVFNIPGMGRLATNAIFAKDYPVMQGVALFIAVIVILSNLLVDISYAWLDPRIRYS